MLRMDFAKKQESWIMLPPIQKPPLGKNAAAGSYVCKQQVNKELVWSDLFVMEWDWKMLDDQFVISLVHLKWMP